MNVANPTAPAPLPVPFTPRLPPLALVAATLLGVGALAFLAGVFLVNTTILKVGCGVLALLLSGACWLVRGYYRASQACELPVSPYHRRYPSDPPGP